MQCMGIKRAGIKLLLSKLVKTLVAYATDNNGSQPQQPQQPHTSGTAQKKLHDNVDST